jgi:hypothetical protein
VRAYLPVPYPGGAKRKRKKKTSKTSIVSFVDLLLFLFGVFWGMCEVNSCNVFLLLFMALWVPTSVTLFRRAVLTLWHAFLFLGLKLFPPLFFFLLGGLHCCFL